MSSVYATTTGFVGHAGANVYVHEGDEWDLNDPFVKAHPEHFSAAAPEAEAEAPAAPKPRRSGRRPAGG